MTKEEAIAIFRTRSVAEDAVKMLDGIACQRLIHHGHRLGISPQTVLYDAIMRGISRLDSEEKFRLKQKRSSP